MGLFGNGCTSFKSFKLTTSYTANLIELLPSNIFVSDLDREIMPESTFKIDAKIVESLPDCSSSCSELYISRKSDDDLDRGIGCFLSTDMEIGLLDDMLANELLLLSKLFVNDELSATSE